ncbi:hypothetical protein [Paraferrimonas haliotis]|uniref:Uncharacterized protein n=1 Tax=Paraferrimonas haliotis TaxID=2013866 RepID=A0AA37TV65_9GAMM|nr:hypothetical protein [Paraferrimonas haliotis]GLS83245.1 hypothetical protein GCM10007894_12220 [Paraferrimonas haliotis]
MVSPYILIILIICVVGFFALFFHPAGYRTLAKLSGYQSFFLCALTGMCLVLLGTLLYLPFGKGAHLFAEWAFCVSWRPFDALFEKAYPTAAIPSWIGTFAEVAVLSCVIALVFIPKKASDRKKAKVKALLNDSESPEFLELINDSNEFGLPILFTLSDRKVYIGYVFGVPTSDYNDVKIIPLVSGYRCKETLKFIPVTPYVTLYKEKHEKDENYTLNKYSVSLPLKDIVHGHLHNFEDHKRFIELESDPSKHSKGTISKA